MIDETRVMNIMWDAVKASVEAGITIMKVYETDFSVKNKSDNSPLTLADMESHITISSRLQSTDIPILSEEGNDIAYAERKEWKVFWLIDPLDGTKEFVNRNGDFTVNIALIESSYPIAGVIYIPVEDVLFLGLPGKGAMKFEQVKRHIDTCQDLEDFLRPGVQLPLVQDERPYTVVCSRSHMSAETEAFIEELKNLHGQIDYASRGSSLKLCMIAEGKADIYPRFAPTMEWDTAAGQAIAEASGAGVVRAEDGKRLQYNKNELLNPWFIVKR